MNYKKFLAGLGALVILVALFFATSALRNKYQIKESTISPNLITKKNIYENKSFGFKIEFPDDFPQFATEQHGNLTYFYLPTTANKVEPQGTQLKFANLFAISAVPISLMEKNKTLCTKMEGPSTDYCRDDIIAQNNYYRFLFTSGQDIPVDIYQNTQLNTAKAASQKIIVNNLPAPADTYLYQDVRAGYQYSYPAYLDGYDLKTLKTDNLSLPRQIDNSGFYTDKFLGNVLDIQYCALSGKCVPTTTNFAMGIGEKYYPESELLKSEIGNLLTKTKIGNYNVYKYEEGAEGEGVIYYMLVSSDGRLVNLSIRYLNEQVNTKYKTVTKFVKYSNQIQTAEKIIESIKFITPLK